jgi:hypothetical protein
MTFEEWFKHYPLPAEIDAMDATDREQWTWALRSAYKTGAEAERNRTWTQDHWTEYERSIVAKERQRIVNLLMIQHESAKDRHNYWHVAANLIQAEVASDT